MDLLKKRKKLQIDDAEEECEVSKAYYLKKKMKSEVQIKVSHSPTM